MLKVPAWLPAMLILLASGVADADAAEKHSLKVKASAYNTVRAQTNNNPTLTAWGDRLKPGMKVIAVSHDLIRLGLKHNTMVRIEGLPGKYQVKDKMNKRWKHKIDIYMGYDTRAARRWGRRTVTIHW